MGRERLEELEGFYLEQLLGDCVPFWFPRMVDERHGGFWHCVDRDGTVVDRDKSVWAQGRMSWMLLTMAGEEWGRGEWVEWAERGLGFLERHGVDEADGRMYFHLAEDGTPIRKRRYAYSESFAAIAYAAHAGLRGDERSAERARGWLEAYFDWNFTPGKMPAKYTGRRPMEGIGTRMIGLVTAQELRRWLGDDEGLRGWRDRCVEEILRLFVKPELGVVMEQVGVDGAVIDHFDGRTLNPGHAIEAAWFLMEEGSERGEGSWVREGLRMLDWMWERGWDKSHGGLLYFCDLHGGPVQEYWHDMKFWWPHDEALIATLMAYRLTGEEKYLGWHERVREWSFAHFGDPEYGEWYGYLRRDGVPTSGLKGTMWKSFFHHPRALWKCWRLAKEAQESGRSR